MRFTDGSPPDPALLRRYVLGTLPAEESERLDEQSIADEDVAALVQGAEHDLLDAYVRAELDADSRARVEAMFLPTADGWGRVALARALATLTPTVAPLMRMPAVSRWLLAAAATAIVAAGAYFLAAPRNVAVATPTTVAVTPAAPATPLLSFVLLAPTRGAIRIPTLTVPAHTPAVELRLTTEATEFPEYEATLTDPAGETVRWKSARVTSEPAAGNALVRVTLPGALLTSGRHVIQLSGVNRGGSADLLGAYAFRVVLE